jgi:hypothetical protein
MNGNRIRHVVLFTLRHARGSAEERAFLADGERILTGVPGVERFEVLRQVSPKTDFDFCFSMEFADRGTYDRYSAHPDHGDFVELRWKTEVARFQEVDLAAS